MNNQAFRKLVHQQTSKTINKSSNHNHTSNNQSPPKSNKEIAREAVQQEFNEIKKKRKFGSGGHGDGGKSGGKGGGGGFFDGDFDMSDDDDHNGNERDNGTKNDDKNGHEKNNNYTKGQRKKYKSGTNKNQDGMKQSQQSRYRDRAKERREGKNLDYMEAERFNLPNSSNSNGNGNDENLTLEQGNTHNNSALSEMTKFLGGDEQFTHLVKGLDKTLADKVRREEMTKQHHHHGDRITSSTTTTEEITSIPSRQSDNNNIDLDQIMEDVQAQAFKVKKQSRQMSNEKIINNIIEAKKSSSSTLVSTMATYLHKLESSKLTSKLSTSTSPSTSTATTSSIHDTIQTPTHHSKLTTAGQTIHRSTLTFSLTNLKRQHAWEIPNTSINARHPVIPLPCTPVDRELIQKIKFALDAISTQKKKQEDEKASRDKQMGKYSTVDVVTNDKVNSHQDDDSDDDIYDNVGDYIPPSIEARQMNT